MVDHGGHLWNMVDLTKSSMPSKQAMKLLLDSSDVNFKQCWSNRSRSTALDHGWLQLVAAGCSKSSICMTFALGAAVICQAPQCGRFYSDKKTGSHPAMHVAAIQMLSRRLQRGWVDMSSWGTTMNANQELLQKLRRQRVPQGPAEESARFLAQFPTKSAAHEALRPRGAFAWVRMTYLLQ